MPRFFPQRTTLARPMLPLLLVVSAVALAPRLVAPARALSTSLYYDEELRAQSECVQRCVVKHVFASDIYSQVGCYDGQTRDCLCHDQLRPAASRFMSRCVAADIKTWDCLDADLPSALSIYNRYCAFGQARGQAGTAGAAGAAATTAVPTATATATATVSAAGTSTPTAATGSGGTLAPNTRLPPTPTTLTAAASSTAAAASGSTKLSVTGGLLVLLAALTAGANLLWCRLLLAHAIA